MLPSIPLNSITFEAPDYLWLLAGPGILLLIWMWKLSRYRRATYRFRARRTLPVRERFSIFGGLLFWLFTILATASSVVALARPVAPISSMRTAGIDLVVLQDGSASMRVRDVAGDRWQRSMRFLRVLAESMRWTNDRLAMAVFARIATPEVRLTTDPNTFFFFLDHLDKESPFRQDDDTTWDTNTELGIYWGIRLINKDEELNGPSPNAKLFLLLSDGQTFSGQVQRSIKLARDRGIPIFVIGVGTAAGGMIPQPEEPNRIGPPPDPIRGVLDRNSLTLIANAGGGSYFELDRETDRDIANAIIDAGRRRAGTAGVQTGTESLYWRFLAASACLLGVGLVFVRDREELWLHALGIGAALLTLWLLTR